MPSPQLERALFPDGQPARVDRIEIEILDSGSCRWTIWREQERLYSAIAKPADQPHMLRATDQLVTTMVRERCPTLN